MKAFFISGTDTGMGKTVVTTGLAAYCSVKKGLDVGVMKPFEAGLILRGKDLLPWDAIRLREAAGNQDALALINPYAFEAPLAPEMAAEQEHVRVDLQHLDRIYKKLLNSHDILFLEGAGGVLVPIRRNFFFSDLIKRWDVPVIVVSRLGLGTINHTLLTCRFLKQEGVRVAGVILNDVDGKQDAAKKSNPGVLERYLDVPLLGTFPFNKKVAQGAADRKSLVRIVEKHIDVDRLLS